MRVTAATLGLCMMFAAGSVIGVRAQTAPDPGSGRGGKGGTVAITVPLNIGGVETFNPDGSFGAQVPGVHVSGVGGIWETGSGQHGRSTPPDPPSISVGDVNGLQDQARHWRVANCLVQADAAPCLPTRVPPGAFNVADTEVDLVRLSRDALEAMWKDAPLPGIVMQANPPRGLAQLESWFWVDRATYEGQVFSTEAQVPVPWTLDWDTLVHHHDSTTGPCADDPALQCTTHHDWDETVHTHQDHLDAIGATVTLSPAKYAWDFGDDEGGPWRGASHTAFPDNSGLGLPFTDPYHSSTVIHKYSQSSLDVFNLGGFLVRLTATWSASGHVRATRDGVVVQDESVALDAREGRYEQRYQVRESQPVLVSAEGGRP
jgi:hypothetical protein